MPKTEWQYAGTVSSHTLIERDLAEAFTDAAKVIAPERADEIDALYNEFIAAEDAEDFETAGFILNEQIYDLMDSLAPEGYYFGSHPGDGSDFGYWENEEEDGE